MDASSTGYFEREHRRMEAQLHAHLLHVVGADFERARTALQRWRRALARHIDIENHRLLPHLPEGARWHRNERGYGKFSRVIRLPFATSDDKVEARMTNGVLRIVISRPEETKPKRIEIKAA